MLNDVMLNFAENLSLRRSRKYGEEEKLVPKVECNFERVSFIFIYAKRLTHPRAEFWPPKKKYKWQSWEFDENINLNCIDYPFRISTNIVLIILFILELSVKSVYNVTETVSFRAQKTKSWDMVPSLNEFKTEIKQWQQRNCTCRLCKTYVNDIGFVEVVDHV